MSREKALETARNNIKEEDVNKIISDIEIASGVKFTDSDKKIFILAHRHGFADGIKYIESNLADFMYG